MDVVLGAKFGPNWFQCCEKSKELALSIGFFSYFAWVIHFKAKVSGSTSTWVEI